MDEDEIIEREYKEEELFAFVREGILGMKGTLLAQRLLPIRARYYVQEFDEGSIGLEEALAELERLAADMGLREVRQWARDELRGYTPSRHSPLPPYRVLPCETVTLAGEIDGELYEGVSYSPILLPLEVTRLLGTDRVYESIPDLEESENRYGGLTLHRIDLLDDLTEATDGMFNCLIVQQNVSAEQLEQITDAVTDRMICEFMDIIDIFEA